MSWLPKALELIRKTERRQGERKKELADKVKNFKNLWNSMKWYEIALSIGLIIVGILLVIKGVRILCGLGN